MQQMATGTYSAVIKTLESKGFLLRTGNFWTPVDRPALEKETSKFVLFAHEPFSPVRPQTHTMLSDSCLS